MRFQRTPKRHNAYISELPISADKSQSKPALSLIVSDRSTATTDLLISRPQTVGSGSTNLILAQIGGVNKFTIDSSGNGYMSGAFGNGGYIAAGSYFAHGSLVMQNGSIRQAGGGQIQLNSSGASISTAGYNDLQLSGNTYTSTSGTNQIVKITPTYNQASGTAANTDLLINRTETAVGSGVQNLLDAQVGGTSKYSVDNKGVVFSGTPAQQFYQVTNFGGF